MGERKFWDVPINSVDDMTQITAYHKAFGAISAEFTCVVARHTKCSRGRKYVSQKILINSDSSDVFRQSTQELLTELTG